MWECSSATKKHSSPSVAAARVGVLKKALAQALVTYYAFSGEVESNSFGEPEILCNNRGVDFTECFADIELKELNLYNPDESIEGKLVPNKKHGVLAIQATELKCGGMVVACTFDHHIADAYSANMFLVSWAKMANSKSLLTEVPSFRRSLLNPRHLGQIHPSLNDMYVRPCYISAASSPNGDQVGSEGPGYQSHILRHSRATYQAPRTCQLHWLQKVQAKLESFSAFLWKMVAESERGNGVKKICKMGIVVDGRSRLADENDSIASYFGNVLSIPFGGKKIQELKEKSLNWVADEVHEFLKYAVTNEHFLGLIDWVEAHRPVPGLAKIYCNGTDEGPAFVVSSGQRFPVSEMDFGCGAPVFGSYHFPWKGSSGYVMPMPSPVGNGDWVVYMHLLKRQLDVIEMEAAHVFKPLTYGHLI